jgi:RimJ/RimL family protein N-acetyltransferase
MATALTNTTHHVRYQREYLASGERVGIREWHQRHDRRQIEHWPEHDQPEQWSQVQRVTSKRISFAVDRFLIGLVGRITLRDFDAAELSARLGLYFHPDFCGLGFGTESLLIFCDWQRSQNLHVIRLDVASDNQRAMRCYQKAGFQVVDCIQRDGVDFFEMEHRLC